MNRPRALNRADGYDELAYRQAIQRLGLVPPIELDDIHRAYRQRAKVIHPDRFARDDDARRAATTRIQELNVARDYAMRHFRWFDADQVRSGSKRKEGDDRATTWREWAGLPITAVYALAMVFTVVPFLALSSLGGEQARERWTSRAWYRVAVLLWRAWLFVGPHVAMVAMFAVVAEPVVKIWFGVSLLVMLSADLATLLTGTTNTLRSQHAMLRLHPLVTR